MGTGPTLSPTTAHAGNTMGLANQFLYHFHAPHRALQPLATLVNSPCGVLNCNNKPSTPLGTCVTDVTLPDTPFSHCECQSAAYIGPNCNIQTGWQVSVFVGGVNNNENKFRALK